ncbi:MAG: hypothetical protein KDD70_03350 [Bdellovibrionales bacterium]|nr:hypothetical protein [Bdellovibrionales bacterium]
MGGLQQDKVRTLSDQGAEQIGRPAGIKDVGALAYLRDRRDDIDHERMKVGRSSFVPLDQIPADPAVSDPLEILMRAEELSRKVMEGSIGMLPTSGVADHNGVSATPSQNGHKLNGHSHNGHSVADPDNFIEIVEDRKAQLAAQMKRDGEVEPLIIEPDGEDLVRDGDRLAKVMKRGMSQQERRDFRRLRQSF